MIKYFKKLFRQRGMSEKDKIFDNMNESIKEVELLINKRREKGFTMWTSGSYSNRTYLGFINSVSYSNNIYFDEAKTMFKEYFRNKGYKVDHFRSNNYQGSYFIYQLTIKWEDL